MSIDFSAVLDADIPEDEIKYQVLGSWWGNVVHMSDITTPITYFTQSSINKKMIGFHHESKNILDMIALMLYSY